MRIQIRLLIFAAKMRGKKADYVFLWSHKQSLIKIEFGNYGMTDEPLFKGKRYTEMKGIQYNGGLSNWDDAKVVGVGSYSDITFQQIKN